MPIIVSRRVEFRMLGFAFNIQRELSLCLILSVAVAAADEGGQSKEDSSIVRNSRIKEFLDSKLERFSVQDADYEVIFKRLNRLSPVPINAELSSTDRRTYSFQWEDIKVIDVLTKVGEQTASTWLEIDGCINFIDQSRKSDPDSSYHILNMKIPSFSVSEVSRRKAALKLLAQPEILERKFYIISRGSFKVGLDDRPMSLAVSDKTAREILNEIVKADGNSFWILFRNERNEKSWNIFSIRRR